MKIENFNRENLPLLRVALDGALSKVAAEWGITLELGTMRFDPRTVEVKVKMFLPSDGAPTPEALAFKRDAKLVGLKAEDLGRTFPFQGRTYTITGLQWRRNGSKVTVTRDDGKGFGSAVEALKRILTVTQ